MVTTITFNTSGKNYRVAVEGDLRNITLNAERRIKLGSRIIKILSARGHKWAKSGIFRLTSSLQAQIEPAGTGHEHYDPIKGTCTFSSLFNEEAAPNLIRDWR